MKEGDEVRITTLPDEVRITKLPAKPRAKVGTGTAQTGDLGVPRWLLVLLGILIGIVVAETVRVAHIVSPGASAFLVATSLGGIVAGVGIEPTRLRSARILLGMACGGVTALFWS